MIGYDLHKPGRDYTSLIESIKALGGWWHHLDSTWFVRTSLTAVQLRDRLRSHIDANDSLLIVDMATNAWASYGLNQKSSTWLQKYL
jgi:hypothetical protein